jgi:hypothetical protein
MPVVPRRLCRRLSSLAPLEIVLDKPTRAHASSGRTVSSLRLPYVLVSVGNYPIHSQHLVTSFLQDYSGLAPTQP